MWRPGKVCEPARGPGVIEPQKLRCMPLATSIVGQCSPCLLRAFMRRKRRSFGDDSLSAPVHRLGHGPIRTVSSAAAGTAASPECAYFPTFFAKRQCAMHLQPALKTYYALHQPEAPRSSSRDTCAQALSAFETCIRLQYNTARPLSFRGEERQRNSESMKLATRLRAHFHELMMNQHAAKTCYSGGRDCPLRRTAPSAGRASC